MRCWRCAAVVVIVAASHPGLARADADSCVNAYEGAQERRSEGRLVAARSLLVACAQESCPDFVAQDCRRWLDEVEAALPTVVFAVREGGRDVEQARVSRDGKVIATRLDGRAVTVDPGKQVFTFESPGRRRRSVELLIAEGEKSRVIAVELTPLPQAHPVLAEWQTPPAPPPGRDGRLPAWLGGLGVVGVAGFVSFGVAGWRQEVDLDRRCAPFCSSIERRSVSRKYVAADVSLGVGVASLAIAGYLYLRERAARP